MRMSAVVLAAAVAGTLDLAYACAAYGVVGVSAQAIFQSIASGVLGRPAFALGWTSALLGVLLHYAILAGAALTYALLAPHTGTLARRAWISGPLFGLAVFVVMNYVVVPLSAAPLKPPSGAFLVGGLLVHAFFVGLPIALLARPADSAGLGARAAA